MLAIIALRYKNAIIIWLNKEICNVAACVQGFFFYIYILKILVYTVLVHTVYTYSTIETRKYEGG